MSFGLRKLEKFPFLAVSPTENWRKSRNSVIFGGFSVKSRKVLEISQMGKNKKERTIEMPSHEL